jgi:transcriptional regulator with XRE-family HTH domain
MAKTIQDLRRERGYRSAREFADALGISPSSMSRYDNQPDAIPTKVAWAMADKLGCSIDEVVGRQHVTAGGSDLQDLYDGLLPETRALVDEFLEFARQRDERARKDRKAEEDAKNDRLCRFHERMFLQSLYERTDFGELGAFETPEKEREAFERFLEDQAAAKRKPGIDDECADLEEELRGGYIDADGTQKEFPEEEIQARLSEEREALEEEFGAQDREVIKGIMEAYDRLHADELRNWAVHTGQGNVRTIIEYSSQRMHE